MAVYKTIKARCRKSGKYIGLQVQVDSDTKGTILGRYLITNPSTVQSTAYLPDLVSGKPCPKCGKKGQGSCSCGPKVLSCGSSTKPNEYCATCKELELDFNELDASALSTSDRELIVKQGGVVALSPGIKKVMVGLGWDPATVGDRIDVDSSVILVNSKDKYNDNELVYFGRLEDSAGSILHHGDDLYGTNSAGEDDEKIDVNLQKVPAKYDMIFFVINVYSGQTFNSIRHLFIRVENSENRKSLLRYNIAQSKMSDRAMVVAKLERCGSTWKFTAIGDSTDHTRLDPLRDYLIFNHVKK